MRQSTKLTRTRRRIDEEERLNAEYPGRWYAEVLDVVTEGQRVVTRTRVTDGVESHVVASFALVRDGAVEVWAEEGAAPPADRRPM